MGGERHRVDEELEFGAFPLWDDFNLDTQEGLGAMSDGYTEHELDFGIQIGALNGFLYFVEGNN